MTESVPLNARAELARIKREADKRATDRREGRKLGLLSQSLEEKLRSCNPLQLRRVKKMCDEYLKDHRSPPEEFDCRKRFTNRVVAVVKLKNKRFQLEFRDCGKHCTKCPHGPYLYSYWRDGSIIKDDYHGKSPFRNIPRKIGSQLTSSTSRRVSYVRAV
jgi:hypothetical protein